MNLLDDLEIVCTVCGTETADFTGSLKHPIYKNCYRDSQKRKIWMEQLREYHPDVYESIDRCMANVKEVSA